MESWEHEETQCEHFLLLWSPGEHEEASVSISCSYGVGLNSFGAEVLIT